MSTATPRLTIWHWPEDEKLATKVRMAIQGSMVFPGGYDWWRAQTAVITESADIRPGQLLITTAPLEDES